MKSFFAYSLFILIIYTSFGQTYSGDSFASAKQKKSADLTYVYEGVEGFCLKSDGGKEEGMLVDLMQEFEKYVQQKYDIAINSNYVGVKDSDFILYLDLVKNGKGGIFGLSNTSINEERKKFLKFSPPYIKNITLIVTNEGVPTLSSMNNIASEFAGMKGYTVVSTTYEKRMQQLKAESYGSLEIEIFDSVYEMMDNVIADPKSFGFVDINYYLEYLKKGKSVKRHPAGDETGDLFGIIMPLNSDWQPVLAEFLDSGILKTPEYRQMVIENLGKGALRMIE